MTRRRLVGLVLGVFAALAAAASASATGHTRVDTSAPQAKVIASATTRDLRVEVIAEKVADPSGAPTAVMRASIWAHAGGTSWFNASHRLKGTYFWYTVTGPRSVCRLEIRTTAARRPLRTQVLVQLLRSPSLGCGPTYRYRPGS